MSDWAKQIGNPEQGVVSAVTANVVPDLFEQRLMRAIWQLNRARPEELLGSNLHGIVERILVEARISFENGDVEHINIEYTCNHKMRQIVNYRVQQITELLSK